MSAHTPAPWRVIETNLLPHEGDHVADMSNGLMVVPFCKLGDPLADARLIAAAPDLLEACKGLMLQFAAFQAECFRNEIDETPAVIVCRNAIVKATTGEQA